MPKKMQKRVLKVMGIWKAKDESESARWIHGHGRKRKKEEIDKWIG